MGPNGSGKSTLANTLLGHPAYEVTEGSILFKGEELHRGRAARAREGGAVPGLPVPGGDPGGLGGELPAHGDQRQARSEPIQVSRSSAAELQHAIELLDVDRSSPRATSTTASRAGEKKRAEILQMAMLKPDVAILDETDSGLDIDALRTVAEGVERLATRAGSGRSDHHPLPAHPALHQAPLRAHHARRADRAGGRGRAGGAPGARGVDEIRREFGSSRRAARARAGGDGPEADAAQRRRRSRSSRVATASRRSTTRCTAPARATAALSSSCARRR